LSTTTAGQVEAANAEVVRRLTEPDVRWVGVGRALDHVPGMKPNLVLHSGPPIRWADMSPLQSESVIGAVLFEGLAKSRDEAVGLLDAGEVELEPCHEHSAVGAMTGVTSASMGMLIVENAEFGNRAYCKVVERQLQFGQHDEDIFANLRWLAEGLGPALDAAVTKLGGISLMPLIAKALHMGDECHNRNVAATALLMQAIAPALAEEAPAGQLPRMLRYFQDIDQAFLGFAMATGKALTEPATGVEASSVVTTMARNGVEFGIKVSGLGNRWFTGPAQPIKGAFMPGYGPEQATNDIGDSTITETIGLGGMVAANALTAGAIGGASSEEVIRRTRDNMQIAAGRSRAFTIPVLDFEGAGVGIDVRHVVKLDSLPMLLTGIGGNQPPFGRIGAGQVFPPVEPFVAALRALGEALAK
jgi:hypothetical protein